jgi:hypothetical protein
MSDGSEVEDVGREVKCVGRKVKSGGSEVMLEACLRIYFLGMEWEV